MRKWIVFQDTNLTHNADYDLIEGDEYGAMPKKIADVLSAIFVIRRDNELSEINTMYLKDKNQNEYDDDDSAY